MKRSGENASWMDGRESERARKKCVMSSQSIGNDEVSHLFLAGWLAQTHTHTQAHWSVSHFGSTPLIEQCNSYSTLTFSILSSPSLFLSRDSVPSLAHSTICLCRAMNIVGQCNCFVWSYNKHVYFSQVDGWKWCVFVYTVTMIGPVGCLWPWF